jgi:hypothetical protein
MLARWWMLEAAGVQHRVLTAVCVCVDDDDDIFVQKDR